MGTKKKEALIRFNQENILAAAKKLFESKGFEAATMDDIAQEADYSKSTVYVYFKSKDEILDTILLEHFTRLLGALRDEIAEYKDFESCYLNICKRLAAFEAEYPFYYMRLLKEIKVTQQDLAEHNLKYEIYKTGEELNDVIELVLRKGIESGYLREDLQLIPTVFYLWSGISSIISFAHEKALYIGMRLQMQPQEYREYCFRLLLNSIKK